MSRTGQADPIRDFIAANRDRYTREAITDQLVAAGHDRALIDEAWEAHTPDVAPTERATDPWMVAYVLLAYAAGLVAVLWTGYWRSLPEWLIAYLVIGGVGALLLVRIRVSGWRWALVVPLVPLIFAAVWYGTCVATLSLFCESILSGGC
jgi:hypothetical protein